MDWFKHDTDAASDPKLMKLVMQHGWEGYGIWWRLVEILAAESDGQLTLDDNQIDSISYCLHIRKIKLVKVLSCCVENELLTQQDGILYSESLRRRLNDYKELREKRRSAARSRWGSDANANALHGECKSNAMGIEWNGVEQNGYEWMGRHTPSGGKPHDNSDPDGQDRGGVGREGAAASEDPSAWFTDLDNVAVRNSSGRRDIWKRIVFRAGVNPAWLWATLITSSRKKPRPIGYLVECLRNPQWVPSDRDQGEAKKEMNKYRDEDMARILNEWANGGRASDV